MIRQRYRIRFRKEGDLRLISHNDLVRTLERLFRRAGLPLGMSEGFHPKARMSFPSALALGTRGIDEVMEVELSREVPPEDVLALLGTRAPPGLAFNEVRVLAPGEGKAQMTAAEYRIPVPPDRAAEARQAIDRLLASPACPVAREGRDKPVDLKADLVALALEDGELSMRLAATRQAGARPRDVLAALGLADLLDQGGCLTRTTVEIEP
jgi:radical SAM-linked protein